MSKTPIRQEIIFVTGKGGVGKSAVAAAIALKKSQGGAKTLLVELGSQSFYQEYFHLPTVVFEPTHLRPNLDLSLWSGQECLKEYARYLLKVESLYRLFFENSVTRSLINVAPALPELAVMGKVTSHPRQVGPPLNYDCIVVDAFATGHFLALLRAPQGMAEAISFGPMGEQSRGITKILKDPDHCQYFVVSIPEELPVQEAQELSRSIQDLVGIEPVQVFNRNWPVTEKTLQSKASASEIEEFKKVMTEKWQRQNELEEKLKKTSSQVISLPWVLDSKAWSVVEKLAEDLP